MKKRANDPILRHWARIGAIREWQRMTAIVLAPFPDALAEMRAHLAIRAADQREDAAHPAPRRRIMPEASRKRLSRQMRARWREVKKGGGRRLTKAAK